MEEKKRGLRNVIALGFVSFFTDVSTEMILGVLPTFIVEDLGAGKAVLGLIDGIADVLNYVFRILSGFISHKLGARKV
ncbi:MAG: MFS transporter, partial [Thermoproteota archaeon]